MRVLLGIRDVRLLLVGQGLSWVGDAFNPIALSVAVVLSGGGAAELGVILASGVVARLLCTLVGGVWADRVTPHRIMVIADLTRAASVGGLALAFAVLGDPPVALLAALAAVTSGAGAFFYPAFVSLRPLIVPVEGPGRGTRHRRSRRRPARVGSRFRRQCADLRVVGPLRRRAPDPRRAT